MPKFKLVWILGVILTMFSSCKSRQNQNSQVQADKPQSTSNPKYKELENQALDQINQMREPDKINFINKINKLSAKVNSMSVDELTQAFRSMSRNIYSVDGWNKIASTLSNPKADLNDQYDTILTYAAVRRRIDSMNSSIKEDVYNELFGRDGSNMLAISADQFFDPVAFGFGAGAVYFAHIALRSAVEDIRGDYAGGLPKLIGGAALLTAAVLTQMPNHQK